jgi:hypothetical protein
MTVPARPAARAACTVIVPAQIGTDPGDQTGTGGDMKSSRLCLDLSLTRPARVAT